MSSYTQTTRHIDYTKSESELTTNIRKATSVEETAPKRKHVRSCIVYTWDHKSSLSFWSGLKIQPLADEIQTFKALITVHKVLQEGHPVTIKEAMAHRNWIDSLQRVSDGHGYASLIAEYVYFLRAKLSFHQQHSEFTGTFEYEEYISLKSINDPNEGYETIGDLMQLQDQIEQFQKLIFSHFRSSANNECRIAALVPLVQESYGIYKFVTSMLRAMHSTTGDDDALEPLRSRYDTQYHRLVKFYDECKNLRYLTSIISLPNLMPDPPNLLAEDERAPRLPERPRLEIERRPTPPPPAPEIDEPEDISEFWKKEQRHQQEYEEQQRVLEEQRAQQLLAQQQAAERAQREFAEQQQLLADQQRREQEALLQQQQQWHTQGRLAELERESLNARAQYNQAQLMLQQYDQRVKTLEGELQQIDSKDAEIRALQSQIQALQTQIQAIPALQDTNDKLRSNYKTLATLYSQLRSEHLDLRKVFKSKELKAASAEEAIQQLEDMRHEREIKQVELNKLVKERDAARLDKDRAERAREKELAEIKRELAETKRELNAQRSKERGLLDLLSDLNRQKSELNEKLQAQDADPELQADHVERLREKELELEVVKMGLDQALIQLNDLKVQAETDRALDGQIDVVLVSHRARIDDMIDAVLQSGVQRVDDALYELESAMQAGNQNASPAYVLSQTEKASSSATEFATAFNNFIADGPEGEQANIIRTIGVFASAISDVLGNTKGLTRLARDDRTADQMLNGARQSAAATVKFFRSLLSFRLDGMDPLQKTDVVINGNNDVQVNLQRLSKLVDACAPSRGKITDDKGGDLGDLVDRELDRAADAVQAAAERLAKLRSKPKDGYATYELRVHEAMLEAAAAVTNAIAQLIRAATATQREIVQAGRGSSSRAAFYKKNNRWTDGLISAAKAVASATNTLIETADGVLSGRNSPEQLIVASNDVAASTAQLVAASRVRAGSMSQSQETLEQASKAVGTACRALVRQVQGMMADRDQEEKVDYGRLGAHEFRVREMEQQVEILQLENQLTAARTRLGEMRKVSYQE